MARQAILRDKDGKQLLPVTGFEQVKRGGGWQNVGGQHVRS